MDPLDIGHVAFLRSQVDYLMRTSSTDRRGKDILASLGTEVAIHPDGTAEIRGDLRSVLSLVNGRRESVLSWLGEGVFSTYTLPLCPREGCGLSTWGYATPNLGTPPTLCHRSAWRPRHLPPGTLRGLGPPLPQSDPSPPLRATISRLRATDSLRAS